MAISEMHRIGEVAELVGLSLRTIRYWDDVALVHPSGHSTGGFRLYTDDDIQRLRLVKALKPLELTLEEMRTLLETRHRLRTSTTSAERRALRTLLASFSAVADERCERLRGQLAAIEEIARTLRSEIAGKVDERIG